MGGTFGGDGYVYGMDFVVSWVYTYLQIQHVVYITYVQLFLYQSYPKQSGLK